MSAELLREAAALMRERAEAASPAPWRVTEESGRGYDDEYWLHTDVTAADGKSAAWYCDEQEGVDNAEYIASWHPAVALAVADWLDAVGKHMQDGRAKGNPKAAAVARAYLGRDA